MALTGITSPTEETMSDISPEQLSKTTEYRESVHK